MTPNELHSKLIDLTAVAGLLAIELADRTIPPKDAERPSAAAVASHLTEQLAALRDEAEPHG